MILLHKSLTQINILQSSLLIKIQENNKMQKLANFLHFSPKTKIEPQKPQQILLPGTLGGQIIDLQVKSQFEMISKQLVFTLIDLYSKAVEFYEEKQNPKYKVYRKRMYNFLTREAVVQILKGKTGEMASKKQTTENIMRKASKSTKEVVNKLIKQSEKQTIQNQKRVKNQIKSQETKLQQRIHKRRTMSNRSTKTGNENEGDFDDFDQIQSANMILDDMMERKVKRVFF